MHSHVMLKRRRSPKIAEMPKEVACRDVVEMRAGLGRIIKQVACQGWGTSSRSTWGSLEVNLMNSVLQNSMFARAWHRLKFIECHKYLQQYVHEYVWMHVDTYILRNFCRVKNLGLVSPYGNHLCSCLFRSAGVSPQREQGWVGNSTSWKFLATQLLVISWSWTFDDIWCTDVFWKISAYIWVKKHCVRAATGCLGPSGATESAAPGKDPQSSAASAWGPRKTRTSRRRSIYLNQRCKWGKCLPFPKPSNSLALEMVFKF